MTQLRVVGGDDDSDDERQGPGRPAAPEFDPWDTDKGHTYSVENFYTRSTNKFDHSKDIRAAVPTTLHGQIQKLVDSKKFTRYHSIADVVRDSLVHRLRTIGGWLNDEELIKILTVEERIDMAEQDAAEVDGIEKLFITYTNEMERFAKSGDIIRLTRQVLNCEDWVYYLESPYQEQAEALAKRFRGELKRLQDRAGG